MSEPIVEVIDLLKQIYDQVLLTKDATVTIQQLVQVGGLSEINPSLGIIKSGEFRTGNNKTPGDGFSGMRIGYPAFTYSTEDWNLVGVEDDVMQVGIRSSDGTLVAGAGSVTLDEDGITATGGYIGGWEITATTIQSTNIILSSESGGSINVASSSVILNSSGITAVAGSIAGWTISSTEIKKSGIILDSSADTIYVGSAVPRIVIDGANKNLASSDFSAGSKGFKIDAGTGNAEFNNITARGAINSSVFTKNEITATAGTLGIFKSAGVLKAAVTTVASPTTFTIDIQDPPSGHAQLFAADDILRIKTGTGDNWISIISASDQTTFYRYTCELESGTPTTFNAGCAVADYGQDGDGFLILTADDTNAPFYSVRTHEGEPWDTTHEVIRLGNLQDIAGFAEGDFGLVGKDLNGVVQFGIDTNGEAFCCNGKIHFTENGIEVSALAGWAIKQYAPYGSAIRRHRIGMSTIGSKPVFTISYYQEDDDATELVDNGGFEDGDFTSWTKQDESNGAFAIEDGAGLTPFKGDYCAVFESDVDNLPAGTLIHDMIEVDVGEFYDYRASVRAIFNSEASGGGGTLGLDIHISFYTAASGGSFVSSHSLINYGIAIEESTPYTELDTGWIIGRGFVQVPATATHAQIVMSMSLTTTPDDTSVKAYFDDLSLVHVDSCSQVQLSEDGFYHNGVELVDDDHNHDTLGGAQVDHTKLSNIGTNTHAQIDTILSTLASGEYEPGSSNVTNVDASTPSANTMYIRFGSYVFVSGRIAIDPTSTGAIEIRLTLPISSTFTSTHQAIGALVRVGGSVVGSVEGYTSTANRVSLTATVNHTGNVAYNWWCLYEVI